MLWIYHFFYAVSAPKVTPYSLSHVIYLLICFFTIFIFVKNSNIIKQKRNKVRKVFLSILLFKQIVLLYGWYLVVTDFDITVSLPIHICRISSLLTIVFLINGNKKVLDVIFYFGFFAITSFFYPKDVYHLAHIQGLSYMINHLVTVLIPIFAYIAYGWRPSVSGYRRGVLAFTVFFIVVFTVNPTIDGNYFYLTSRPFFNSWSYLNYSVFAYFGTVIAYSLVTYILIYGHAHAPWIKKTIKV